MRPVVAANAAGLEPGGRATESASPDLEAQTSAYQHTGLDATSAPAQLRRNPSRGGEAASASPTRTQQTPARLASAVWQGSRRRHGSDELAGMAATLRTPQLRRVSPRLSDVCDDEAGDGRESAPLPPLSPDAKTSMKYQVARAGAWLQRALLPHGRAEPLQSRARSTLSGMASFMMFSRQKDDCRRGGGGDDEPLVGDRDKQAEDSDDKNGGCGHNSGGGNGSVNDDGRKSYTSWEQDEEDIYYADQSAERLALSDQRAIEMTKVEFEVYVHKQVKDQSVGAWLLLRSVCGLPLVSPWHAWYRLWYYLIWFLDVVYTSIIFPWYMAFGAAFTVSELNNFAISIVECILGCIFLIDAFIEIHTPYLLRYKNDKLLVINGGRIFWLALWRTSWFVDLASAVVFLVVTAWFFESPEGSSALQALRLVRLVRLHRTIDMCSSLMTGTWVTSVVALKYLVGRKWMSLRLAYVLGLLFTTLVSINLLACLWWFVGVGTNNIWPDPEDHWLAHAGGLGDITNDNAAVQYISAFYYVFTTMTTVGYGDIYGYNTVEVIVSVGIMCFSAVFFAFLIGSVVNQLLAAGPTARRSDAFKNKVTTAEQLFSINDVSGRLRHQAYRALSHVWLVQHEQLELWSILDDLGNSLRMRLMAEVVGRELRALDIFAQVSQRTLQYIASTLEPIPCVPSYILYEQGSPADDIYLLQEGEVEALRNNQVIESSVWAPGILGRAALTKLSKDAPASVNQFLTIRTITSCLIFKLPIAKLQALLDSLAREESDELRECLYHATQGSSALKSYHTRFPISAPGRKSASGSGIQHTRAFRGRSDNNLPWTVELSPDEVATMLGRGGESTNIMGDAVREEPAAEAAAAAADAAEARAEAEAAEGAPADAVREEPAAEAAAAAADAAEARAEAEAAEGAPADAVREEPAAEAAAAAADAAEAHAEAEAAAGTPADAAEARAKADLAAAAADAAAAQAEGEAAARTPAEADAAVAPRAARLPPPAPAPPDEAATAAPASAPPELPLPAVPREAYQADGRPE